MRGCSPTICCWDGDDVDAASAKRLQDRLQLGLEHRELAVDDRLVDVPYFAVPASDRLMLTCEPAGSSSDPRLSTT